MKRINVFLMLFTFCSLTISAQRSGIIVTKAGTGLPVSKVDFDAFETLTKVVKEYRKGRLVKLDNFISYSKEKNTIILDTRSAEMYKRKHVKGAVHLNFSDFTEANLGRLIPNPNTRILIYCNNNFANDEIRFATKMARPEMGKKPVTLALNIPTFINLYGYGYKNVYELADLVSVFSPAIQFEGTDVLKINRSTAGNKR